MAKKEKMELRGENEKGGKGTGRMLFTTFLFSPFFQCTVYSLLHTLCATNSLCARWKMEFYFRY
jgi:hypothetical protein